MVFFRFLLTYARWTLFFSVAAGLVSGLGLSGVMAVIHRSLDDGTQNLPLLFFAFVFLWIVHGCCCILSESLLIRLAEKITFRLKMALCEQVFRKELRELEAIGSHRLFTVLAQDIPSITYLLERLPNAFINTTIVLGCYAYMLWLSPTLFLINALIVLVSVGLFTLPMRSAKQKLAKAREISDSATASFRDLTDGVKELLVHRPKRRAFLNGIIHDINRRQMKHNIGAKAIYAVSQRLGELLVLADIGCIVFVLPRFIAVDGHLLTGFILASMFSLSPLSTLLGFIPHWARVNVSMKKVHGYGFDLFSTGAETADALPPTGLPPSGVHKLSLNQIRFEYRDSIRGDGFTVGPVRLEMKSGQVTFLIGGNGSGKTTLAKLICGLYPPTQGDICWNDVSVDSANRDEYRQHFSVVFSDYFLMRHLAGIEKEQIDRHAADYLSRLQLHDKVTVDQGAFSTIDLSFGQRKRLALLAACLEDRPVYIFDEWAAGQDPAFKRIFYEEILMDLKKRGKMVLVITHDDNYIPVADRVIKLEDGHIGEQPDRFSGD